MYLQFVALILLSLPIGRASSSANCPIDADSLYAVFKEYRIKSLHPDTTDEELAKYFLSSRLDSLNSILKDITDEKERLNAYRFNLRLVPVHEVYDYRVSCGRAGEEELIMSALAFYGHARNWLNFRDPSEVTILYRKENGRWRMDKSSYDSTKETRARLNTSRVIDKFSDPINELERKE